MTNKTEHIPEIPNEIKDAASQGRLVVFVGAGVSRLAGCPSWDELAQEILKKVFNLGEITYHEYSNLKKYDARKLISISLNIIKGGNGRFIKDLLTDKLSHNNELDIFRDLYNLKAIYVTTNLDTCLDDVANERSNRIVDKGSYKAPSPRIASVREEPKAEVYYKPSEILISHLNQGNVIHLHGGIGDPGFNQNEIILTTTQYLAHYNNEIITFFLEELFFNYTVLFVGYGLEEYELLEYLIKSVKNKITVPEIKEKKHFMLFPVFKAETSLLNILKNHYLNDFGIEPKAYYIDKKGYAKLFEVIKEWSKHIGPMSKPQSFIEQTKFIDEVL